MQKQENRVELNRGQIIDRIIMRLNQRKVLDNRNYLIQPNNITV